MGIREWRKVATEVKERWNRGSLASHDESWTHCALGAIGTVVMNDKEFGEGVGGYTYLSDTKSAREMVKELAIELTETMTKTAFNEATGYHPDVVKAFDAEHNADELQHIVLRVNDRRYGQTRIAKAVDSILAKREAKAAQRREAKAAREAERAALLKKKELRVEYQPVTINIEEKVTTKTV